MAKGLPPVPMTPQLGYGTEPQLIVELVVGKHHVTALDVFVSYTRCCGKKKRRFTLMVRSKRSGTEISASA